jgi:hypothetical protein
VKLIRPKAKPNLRNIDVSSILSDETKLDSILNAETEPDQKNSHLSSFTAQQTFVEQLSAKNQILTALYSFVDSYHSPIEMKIQVLILSDQNIQNIDKSLKDKEDRFIDIESDVLPSKPSIWWNSDAIKNKDSSFATIVNEIIGSTIVLKQHKTSNIEQYYTIYLDGISENVFLTFSINIRESYAQHLFSYPSINFFWQSINKVCNFVISDSFFWYQSYFNIFCTRDNPFEMWPTIPKLTRHFHSVDGNSLYIPYKGKFAFIFSPEKKVSKLSVVWKAIEHIPAANSILLQ